MLAARARCRDGLEGVPVALEPKLARVKPGYIDSICVKRRAGIFEEPYKVYLSTATLLVVPSVLVHQWVTEINKVREMSRPAAFLC